MARSSSRDRGLPARTRSEKLRNCQRNSARPGAEHLSTTGGSGVSRISGVRAASLQSQSDIAPDPVRLHPDIVQGASRVRATHINTPCRSYPEYVRVQFRVNASAILSRCRFYPELFQIRSQMRAGPLWSPFRFHSDGVRLRSQVRATSIRSACGLNPKQLRIRPMLAARSSESMFKPLKMNRLRHLLAS